MSGDTWRYEVPIILQTLLYLAVLVGGLASLRKGPWASVLSVAGLLLLVNPAYWVWTRFGDHYPGQWDAYAVLIVSMIGLGLLVLGAFMSRSAAPTGTGPAVAWATTPAPTPSTATSAGTATPARAASAPWWDHDLARWRTATHAWDESSGRWVPLG